MHFERTCAGKGGLPRPEMQNKHNISMKVTLGKRSSCAHSPDSDPMQEITQNFEQKALIRWGRQNHCAAVQRSTLGLVDRPRPGRTPQPSAVPRTHQQPLQQGGRLGKGYICTKAPTVRERSIGDGPGDTMAIETQLENQQE